MSAKSYNDSFTTMFFKLVVLTCSFLFATPVFSQVSYITIKEADTGEEIPEVTLVFTSLKTDLKTYASTDIYGNVPNQIENPSKLEIIYTGFKKLTDTISPNISKTYFLEADVFNLDQVVITATRTDKTLKNTPVLTQVITNKQMENRGMQSVEAVLNTEILGVEFQQAGFGVGINMQGLTASNMLILVDGERLAGETNANVDYARLNTQEVERIEIVRGASSALYGSQAMGAVVNLISKNSTKAFYASFSNQYTSNFEKNYPNINPNEYDYTAKKNVDKSNLTQNYTLGFNTKKWQGKTNFVYKTKDAYRLYDRGVLFRDYYEFDVQEPEPKELFYVDGSKDFNITQQVGYKVNDKINLTAKGSYYQQTKYDFVPDNKHELYDDFNYTIKADFKPTNRFNYMISYHDDSYKKFDYLEVSDKKRLEYNHHIINPKLISSYILNSKHTLTTGVEYYYESLEATILNTDFESLSNEVVFVQDDIEFKKNWNMVLGARLDHHTSFGLHFSPKLSLMFKNNPFTYRLNYSSGYRSPTLKEMYTELPIGSRFVIAGNPALKPETNQYIATSIEYSKSKINTSVSLYRNAFRDKIDFTWLNNHTLLQYKNTKNATLIGVDYNLHYQPNKSWFLKGAYSFLHEIGDEVIRLSSFSPHVGSLQLGYTLKRKDYRLNATLTGKYTGAKEYSDIDEQFETNGETVEAYYTTTYKAYSMWRASIHQEYANKISVTLGVNNLLDYTPVMYTFNTSITPGRSFFVNLKLNIDQFINNQSK